MSDSRLRKATLTIGEVSERTGLAPSAIRFYEEKGLVEPIRTASNRRLYRRADIRILSFAMIAQQLGLSLSDIRNDIQRLPPGRAPTKRDWERISTRIARKLDDRIGQLTRLRDRLDGCIGCGCLSLESCQLYNPEDRAARHGPGPQNVIRENP